MTDAHLRSSGLVAALAVGLLAFFLRNADLGQVWREIARADGRLLACRARHDGMNLVLRAFRWQYLLAPLGHAGFRNAFRATAIGFAASTVLPARAGEVDAPVPARAHGRA